MVKRTAAGKTEAMLMSIYYPNGPIPVTPLGPEDQQDLFYAHIDNENFDAAKKQVDAFIKTAHICDASMVRQRRSRTITGCWDSRC
jgi:hypothetical protein